MRAFLMVMVLSLAACTTDETAQSGEQAAAGAAAEQFPNVDVAATANCVRDNASADELAIMAAGGDAAARLTAEILGRPATQTCLSDNGVTIGGASG